MENGFSLTNNEYPSNSANMYYLLVSVYIANSKDLACVIEKLFFSMVIFPSGVKLPEVSGGSGLCIVASESI